MDLQPRKKPNLLRELAVALGLTVGLVIAGVLLGSLAIQLFGGVEQWLTWRADNYLGLLAWRLCLYAGIATAWIGLRRRLPLPEPGPARNRLHRIEVLVVLLAAIVELIKAPVNWMEVL
ncbi:hypothetical protein [Azotobacter vinelandii]|uniref:hypothetical protein n=1 Tax=Azotobacter vinelandii TaxID=354 RepID=UPI0026669F23|nr:hypothetical protein [Azotobacter vinelandii]WKN23100.1 hypothetical protein AVAEIV_001126 [Azotobacter vinelandii]